MGTSVRGGCVVIFQQPPDVIFVGQTRAEALGSRRAGWPHVLERIDGAIDGAGVGAV